MFFRVHHSFGARHVRIGMLEQPQAKLLFQHSPDSLVHQRHGDLSFFNVFNQRAHVSGLISDVHVDPRSQSQCARFLLSGNNALIDQRSEAIAFAHHESFKAQFPPQDFGIPFFGAVLRHVIDLRVSRHDTEGACLERRAPGRQKGFTETTFR